MERPTEAVHGASRPVLLATTNLPFWRGGSGAHERMLALYRYLANATTLHILCLDRLSAEEREAIETAVPGAALHEAPPALVLRRKARRRIRKSLCNLLPPLASAWADHFGEDRRAFQRLVQTLQPDAVLVEYPYLGELVWGLPKADRPITILDTIDSLALRRESYVRVGRDAPPDLHSAEWEEARLAPFDVLLAIQSEEAAHFRARYPSKTILLAGHPGDLQVAKSAANHPARLLFLGADNSHNRVALDWFLAEVWPALEDAPVELHVAGGISAHVRGEKGIHALGYVEDLAVLYANTDIVLNPALVGSGLKIKNIDALRHGKCLVTTATGAEGFPQGPGAPLVVCTGGEDMAARLRALADDAAMRENYAQRAVDYARSHLTPDAVYRELGAWLEGLGNTWRVAWRSGRLVGPAGTLDDVAAGAAPDIDVARESLDAWAATTDAAAQFEEDGHQGLWWFLRFELVHDVFFKALPNLRLLQRYREETGPLRRIMLHAPPDFWWEALFRAVYPEAELRVLPGASRTPRWPMLRRRILRVLRGLLSMYRLRRFGVPEKPRLVVVQQARYWRGGKDTFWTEATKELAQAGYEIVPFVTSQLDFADDFRPVLQRPRQTLFADMVYVSGMLHGTFRAPERIPELPSTPLEFHGVDMAPLLRAVVAQRYPGIARAQRCYRAELPGILRRLYATAVLCVDENGGEWALKAAAQSEGVPVIAVQHGVIHGGHCHYVYPEGTSPAQVPLPNLSCTRGQYYRDLLLERGGYAADLVRVTGNLESTAGHTDSINLDAQAEALRASVLPPDCTRLLLFTSQDLLYTLLSGRLLDAFAASTPANFLVIRPHPRERDAAYWEAELTRMGLSGRAAVRRDGDLSLWLRACHAHLSGASTVLEEAVATGRPNIVVGADLLGDWLWVIEGGTGISLEAAGSLDAALAWWDAQPADEIAARRDTYLRGRSLPNAAGEFVKAVDGLLRPRPDAS